MADPIVILFPINNVYFCVHAQYKKHFNIYYDIRSMLHCYIQFRILSMPFDQNITENRDYFMKQNIVSHAECSQIHL